MHKGSHLPPHQLDNQPTINSEEKILNKMGKT